MTAIVVKDYDNEQKRTEVDKSPDTCPFCHRDITPRMVDAFYLDQTQHNIQIVFRCPNRSCQKVFVGYYHAPTPSN